MRTVVRHLRIVWRTESPPTELRVAMIAKKLAFIGFAGLIGAFGLALLNAAAFFWLQSRWGAAVAALWVALGDFIIAALMLVYGLLLKGGAETGMLHEVRDLAFQDLEAEAAGIERELAALRALITEFVQHPFTSIAPSILLPLLRSVISSLRTTPK